MADGYITIETKLSTDKFDKQITDLEKKIKNEEEKTQLKLKAKLQAEDELKRHKQAIFEVEKEYERTSKQVEHLQNLMSKQASGVSLTPQEFTDLQGSKQIIAENDKIGLQLDKMYAKEVSMNNAVDKTALAYKQVEQNVTDYKAKIESVKLQKQQAQVNEIKKGFDSVGNSVSSSIKHIGRLALGVLSVASAYRLMSSASSTLGQYDEQYATNLEYIRYLLAQVLAPALKYIVNLAGTLLSYLNYIAQAWFNVTLFSKNSAKNFAKAQGSTSKIKKDLQSTPFDEMNILQDTSSSGGGGGVEPSIDPSMLAGEVPDWLQFIVDHKDEILAVMAGVAVGLELWKLGLEGIKALGIGVAVAGLVYAIQSLIEYLNDPTFENFGKILQGIGAAVAGLGLVISGPAGLIVGIVGGIVLLWGTIVKYWEQIKSFLQKGIDWLFSKSDWIRQMFGDVVGDIYNNFVGGLQGILNWLDSTMKGIKANFNEIISFVKNVFAGNWQGAWQNIKNIFSNIWEGMKNTVKTIFSLISKMAINIGKTVGATISGAFKAVVNGVLWAIEHILNKPIRTINSLVGVINKVPGINLGYLPTFKLPRLKSGGIINLPGRGIPVGGGTAIGGEAGKEGVLPLTDTQAMETLGETIGKYVTINANIVNSMNGRVISRQLQRIQNEKSFAYNG